MSGKELEQALALRCAAVDDDHRGHGGVPQVHQRGRCLTSCVCGCSALWLSSASSGGSVVPS